MTPILYSGEYFDANLGMYYLRSRIVNQATGRFLTLDTDEGSQRDPQSLHKFLYCADNPVNLSDPSGRFFDTISTLSSTLFNFQLKGRDAVRVEAGRQAGLKGIGLVYLLVTMKIALTYEPGVLDSSDQMEIIKQRTAREDNPTKSSFAYRHRKCIEFADDAVAYFRLISSSCPISSGRE